MSRRSPLHDVHTELGAAFTDFAGWSMPVRYASDLAEHRAVRATAGVFDLSHMGELRVSGPGAGAALDATLVGRPSGMAVRRAAYGMLTAEDGGVVDDLVTYRTGEEDFLVVANASNVDAVAAALRERAAGHDARVTDETAATALVAVQGPTSALAVGEVVELADGGDLADLRYYRCAPARLRTADGALDVLLARTGYTGEDGFEVFAPAERAVEAWSALLAAGRAHDAVPCGLACRDTLRLEAGMPLYGHELTRGVDPYAARLGRVVKLDKPDGFPGREALERLAGTTPQRLLVGLRGEGRRAPRQGYDVLAGDEVVGVVTSGALSPTLGHPVAMAYVDTARSDVGTALAVDVRGRPEPVEVVELPFYRRS
ncbi:glycine cleavage system aminomethyltransferase GcvT [Kineococcus terrestris]|uniref:glycine cleavage system aminomethyltransferase GcvT n=1 Tax=Kineococcus terrestris TaxID=2044856 RepID=UPI0034DAF8C2